MYRLSGLSSLFSRDLLDFIRQLEGFENKSRKPLMTVFHLIHILMKTTFDAIHIKATLMKTDDKESIIVSAFNSMHRISLIHIP